jgi:hypothetical protein
MPEFSIGIGDWVVLVTLVIFTGSGIKPVPPLDNR